MSVGKDYGDAWWKSFELSGKVANDNTILSDVRALAAKVILATDAYERKEVDSVEFITLLMLKAEELKALANKIGR